MNKLVLIHTVKPLIEVFSNLCILLLPNASVLHILDEPLLYMVQHGIGTEKNAALQLQGHVAAAEKVESKAVLVTCSTISPLVDKVSSVIPVVKIDDAMIREAVQRGSVIGVVATASSTLDPTKNALENEAGVVKKSIETKMVHVEDALESLLRGDAPRHDEKVVAAVHGLSKEVDVIVLAQASMARVLDVLPESQKTVPVLSSPHLALEHMKPLFEA
jgi:Asp/Glu/hydantoin racemase